MGDLLQELISMSNLLVPEIKIKSKTTLKVAIIYDSNGGTTKLVAEQVAKGVAIVEGIEVDLLDTEEATNKLRVLDQYDGYIWGSPTLFGSISAKLKAFIEKTGFIYAGRGFQDKLAGGFTNSASPGGDKQGALFQLMTYSTQHGLLWVPLGLPAKNNKVLRNEEEYNRGGWFSGLATQSYLDAAKDVLNPPEADLKTARYYGERFAKVALQYYK